MASTEIKSLMNAFRKIECEPIIIIEVEPIIEEVLPHEEQSINFLNNLKEDDSGIAEFGDVKIYYEPKGWHLYENEQDQFLENVVLKEANHYPTEIGIINNVYYAVYSTSVLTENFGTPYPGTYEQENNKFKSKGPQRFTAMTSMTTEDQLNELADNPYSYQEVYKTPNVHAFDFKTDNGLLYHVFLYYQNLYQEMGIHFELEKPTGEMSYKKENTGDAFKVLSTVAKIILEEIKEYKPEYIHIAADTNEPSRIKLYKALAVKLTHVAPNYKIFSNSRQRLAPNHAGTVITLSKTDK